MCSLEHWNIFSQKANWLWCWCLFFLPCFWSYGWRHERVRSFELVGEFHFYWAPNVSSATHIGRREIENLSLARTKQPKAFQVNENKTLWESTFWSPCFQSANFPLHNSTNCSPFPDLRNFTFYISLSARVAIRVSLDGLTEL